MKSLISNKEFYKRHNKELEKYLLFKNSLHLINETSSAKVKPQGSVVKYLDLETKLNLQLEEIKSTKFELIILSDVIEVYDDLPNLFETINALLIEDGNLLITSINTKWKIPLKILEFLNFKAKTKQFSYIHSRKFENIAAGVGFDLISSKTRQFLPFKLFYLGNILNKILEVLFFNFNLGIRSYLLFRKDNQTFKKMTKSIIIPAKNEEGNLKELVARIPKTLDTELIFSIGKSQDKTLDVALKIQQHNKDFIIKVYEQSKNGKANAVWEAVEKSEGEIIAILDSDISVDPEELVNFYEIIENNYADFVNGTRLIYEMEKGSMRFINKLGNRIFQYLIGKIINEPITDSLCGTKVFKRNLSNNIFWWQNTFKLNDPFGDFDLLFAASYSGAKILEYPIHYRARTYGTTQISRFRDGYKLIRYLFKSFLIMNTTR